MGTSMGYWREGVDDGLEAPKPVDQLAPAPAGARARARARARACARARARARACAYARARGRGTPQAPAPGLRPTDQRCGQEVLHASTRSPWEPRRGDVRVRPLPVLTRTRLAVHFSRCFGGVNSRVCFGCLFLGTV
jgi:hypothetical protein